jgi:hypothetical protein
LVVTQSCSLFNPEAAIAWPVSSSFWYLPDDKCSTDPVSNSPTKRDEHVMEI